MNKTYLLITSSFLVLALAPLSQALATHDFIEGRKIEVSSAQGDQNNADQYQGAPTATAGIGGSPFDPRRP